MPACVLSLGNFDGVHDGHLHLLRQARVVANAKELPLHVLTFWPHPRMVLSAQQPMSLLMPLEKRLDTLQRLADQVHVLPFSLKTASLSPEAFHDLLVKTYGAAHIVVGENFRYGKKAAGSIATLATEPVFEVTAVPLLADGLGIISSSRLRG